MPRLGDQLPNGGAFLAELAAERAGQARASRERVAARGARRLGVSRSHLCDVEKGRKLVSPERAAAWAKVFGFPETVFVKLALQEQLDKAGVKMSVQVEAA